METMVVKVANVNVFERTAGIVCAGGSTYKQSAVLSVHRRKWRHI